jgi:hypothetical protein
MDETLDYVIAYESMPDQEIEHRLEALGLRVEGRISDALHIYKLSYQGDIRQLDKVLEETAKLPGVKYIEPDKSDYEIK